MIEVDKLTRYYGRFAALRDVSFSTGEREIVGFLGLNGAGKSTTLKILAGLLLPSAGTVRIEGVDAFSAQDELRKRIGFLPEEPPLYREMRVGEFLRWCGGVKGKSTAEVDKALPEVMSVCQIDHVEDRVIGELSHGYKKRVGIAQAIIHRPSLVILDEPISGLDPAQIVEMRAVVKQLKDYATVLVSSHILTEIEQTCDRILVFHEGRLVAQGTEESLARDIGSGRRIVIEVRGAADALEGALRGSDAVETCEVQAMADGRASADVTLTGDHREQVVAALVSAGLGVRRVADARGELEQIFLSLTGEAA